MRPKAEIYTPKRDDEHPYPCHMRSPPPPAGRKRRRENVPGARSSKAPAENFSGSKAIFKIKTRRIVAQFLANQPVNFAFLTDSLVIA